MPPRLSTATGASSERSPRHDSSTSGRARRGARRRLLLCLALLIVIGAAVDIGRAFIERRELVSLADEAALSGSQALDLDALHAGRLVLDPGEAQATAVAVLAGEPDLQAQASASPDR